MYSSEFFKDHYMLWYSVVLGDVICDVTWVCTRVMSMGAA